MVQKLTTNSTGLMNKYEGGGVIARIYGASWDGLAPPALVRTDSAVGKVANPGVDAGIVANDFDSIYPWSAMEAHIDVFGNVFIRIPKFYIEKTAVGVARTWRISGAPFGNSYIPACFANASYIDVGKYNANLNGAAIESRVATFPYYNATIVQMRAAAVANGAGYYQMDIHVADIIRTLFYVEFATLHSQSVMYGFANGAYNAAHT